MRGKVASIFVPAISSRITPAYAGKSPRGTPRQQISRDHPRLCGEKLYLVCPAMITLGSPPPMRGKGFAAGVLMPACGITPAYAGKSDVTVLQNGIAEDHPRLCGEKLLQYHRLIWYRGSPPPMRGKVPIIPVCVCDAGITPAYAGKRSFYFTSHRVFQDHPRLCGEKFPSPSPPTYAEGSPPPMRGKGIKRL